MAGERTQKRWLDPTISIGNIVQVVVIAASVIGGYYNLKIEITENASAIERVDAITSERIHQNTAVDQMHMRNLNTNLERILGRLAEIEKSMRDRSQN